MPKTAAALLATPQRQRLLEQIWQRTSLSRAQFAALYRTPIERYAALVQDFPASEGHHHAYPGGMLDHTLDVVGYALKLRQSHLLPVAAPPETQAFQSEAWTAAVAYAALLHDVGKIAVDLHVEYESGEAWHPWHGALCRPYRFRYREDRQYRLHSAATGLLYASVLDGAMMDWLSAFPDLWASLLYVLAGQFEHAGILGEIVTQADQASVAADLGGDPSKVRQAPKQALQRKLLEGLRHLVRNELKLNQPRFSEGWLTQDGLWLVSKTACDKLRAYLLAQGVEGIPSDNIRVFSELQDHGIAQANREGTAIWKATVTASDGAWSHTFTLLKVAPALIWEPSERPVIFSGSVRSEQQGAAELTTPEHGRLTAHASVDPAPSTLSSEVQDAIGNALSLVSGALSASEFTSPAELATANEPPSPTRPESLSDDSSAEPAAENAHGTHDSPGMRFCSWLRIAIAQRRLVINDAKALVHTVAGTAYLVTPAIFMRYAHEHPEIEPMAAQHKMAGWQWIQKQFEKQRIHKKQANGLNVWTCEVKGPRKTRRVHGYVLEDPHTLFADVPADNPYLTLLTETTVASTRAAKTMRESLTP